ncbi:CpaD family pilus assembly protein [Shinella sp. HZN7]|jgi:pilus assembly protein CpaD|uniref:CpaD family pilus assembly protein n=1 Tax=Shinella sp. (strain HZN7) TaxID=879274 RepID=UPI000AA0463A
MRDTTSKTWLPARNRTMHQTLPMRAALAATLVLSATLLAGCGARPDRSATASIPDDYRTRHPIVLSETAQTMDIPVAIGDRALTMAMRDNIRGFAADHAAKSRSAVQIMLPRGSANAATANNLRKDIRTTLTVAGVKRDQLIETSYDASGYGANAPIRLAFFAITAQTGPCGQWPEDLVVNTMENRNYHNFGCASQANLAAQIANPMDLVQPRGMTEIDAARRSNVIDDYRDIGQPPL